MFLLKNKFDKYIKLLPSVQDKHGFIYSDECDSLLFSGLIGCVPEIKVDIEAAFDSDKQTWQRRPIENPCYPCGSKSSISRDMLLGLAWYAWFNKRLDISEQVIKYALSHWLVMGEGLKSRTILMPGLLATYAEISYRLGGPNRWWLRYCPQIESTSMTGYQAHLSILHVLLRKELTGNSSSLYKRTVKAQYERQPNNPLYAYAAGDIDKAVQLLSDERYWPSDRLPTERDREANWLFQRDEGEAWLPGYGNKVYSGGDYIFLTYLITR